MQSVLRCFNIQLLKEQDGKKAVKKVYYPGLKSDPGFEVQKKQADGPGAMISFVLNKEYDYKEFYGLNGYTFDDANLTIVKTLDASTVGNNYST